MNFEREPWRPLFLREPVAQRGWNLVTRGLRTYLLRVAEDDGTLLKQCANPFDLAAHLAVHGEEIDLVRGAIRTLLHDGFLQWQGDEVDPGWLGVDRLVTFAGTGGPSGESAGDRRKRLDRERKRLRRRADNGEDASALGADNGCGQGADNGADISALPPQSPPSDRYDKIREIGENTGARSGARVRKTSADTADGQSGRTLRTPDGAGTRSPHWWKYPEGWCWSEDTWQAAAVLGLTAAELQEHVDYWTVHEFTRPTTSLDKDLVRCLGTIAAKASTVRAKARASSGAQTLIDRANAMEDR